MTGPIDEKRTVHGDFGRLDCSKLCRSSAERGKVLCDPKSKKARRSSAIRTARVLEWKEYCGGCGWLRIHTHVRYGWEERCCKRWTATLRNSSWSRAVHVRIARSFPRCEAVQLLKASHVMSTFKNTSAAPRQKSSKLVSTEACQVMAVRSKGVAVRIFSFTKYRLVLAIARQCN